MKRLWHLPQAFHCKTLQDSVLADVVFHPKNPAIRHAYATFWLLYLKI